MKRLEININNLEVILNSYLYNAEFTPNDIEYSKEAQKLKINFKRIYFEDLSQVQRLKILPFLIIYKYPLILSKLHLEPITECHWRILDNEIKYHKFEACVISKNICNCFFNTLFDMSFKISDNLGGYLEDCYMVANERKKYFSIFSKKDFFYEVREKLKEFLEG